MASRILWAIFVLINIPLAVAIISYSDTSNGAAVAAMIVVGDMIFFVIYCLPIFIADHRRNRNLAAVVIVNVFLGWSMIGWAVALVMAFSGDTFASTKAREAKERADRLAQEQAIARAVTEALRTTSAGTLRATRD